MGSLADSEPEVNRRMSGFSSDGIPLRRKSLPWIPASNFGVQGLGPGVQIPRIMGEPKPNRRFSTPAPVRKRISDIVYLPRRVDADGDVLMASPGELNFETPMNGNKRRRHSAIDPGSTFRCPASSSPPKRLQ